MAFLNVDPQENQNAMNPKIVIRSETEADVNAITKVTVAAFETLAISNHTEQYIITALRAAKALTLSLVAEVEGRVIGHIAFSPVTISDGTRNWYGLGPVSVLPAYQRQGVGKALIREGLARLKAMDAQGCCLVGHPDYYRKFGFINKRDPTKRGGRPPQLQHGFEALELGRAQIDSLGCACIGMRLPEGLGSGPGFESLPRLPDRMGREECEFVIAGPLQQIEGLEPRHLIKMGLAVAPYLNEVRLFTRCNPESVHRYKHRGVLSPIGAVKNPAST